MSGQQQAHVDPFISPVLKAVTVPGDHGIKRFRIPCLPCVIAMETNLRLTVRSVEPRQRLTSPLLVNPEHKAANAPVRSVGTPLATNITGAYHRLERPLVAAEPSPVHNEGATETGASRTRADGSNAFGRRASSSRAMFRKRNRRSKLANNRMGTGFFRPHLLSMHIGIDAHALCPPGWQ